MALPRKINHDNAFISKIDPDTFIDCPCGRGFCHAKSGVNYLKFYIVKVGNPEKIQIFDPG